MFIAVRNIAGSVQQVNWKGAFAFHGIHYLNTSSVSSADTHVEKRVKPSVVEFIRDGFNFWAHRQRTVHTLYDFFLIKFQHCTSS